MRFSAPPTVVFDLDGTLVDTVPDIASALDYALAPYDLAQTNADEAATMMGDGLSEFFWRALVAKRLNLSAMEADAVRRRFIEAYRRSPAYLSKVYPGIRELLGELRALGVLTAVCTNKVEAIAIDILERLGLLQQFDAVVGQRGDRPMKPHPGPVLEAISRAGGSVERALLVGDTGADNGAAIAAQIPVILVVGGYSHIPVSAMTYGTIVDSPESLRAAILSYLGIKHAAVWSSSYRRAA